MKLLKMLIAGALLGAIALGCSAKEEGDITATPEPAKSTPEKPADDKAGATGATGTTGVSGTGTTGSAPEKPADDKAAAEPPKSDSK
jgi:hypothetical protein